MYYIVFTCLLVAVLVLGEIIGLLIQCENITFLHRAKKYVWCVPILQVCMFFRFLYESFKERDIKYILLFLFYGQSSIIILGCISNNLTQLEANCVIPKKISWPFFKEAVGSAMVAIEASA